MEEKCGVFGCKIGCTYGTQSHTDTKAARSRSSATERTLFQSRRAASGLYETKNMKMRAPLLLHIRLFSPDFTSTLQYIVMYAGGSL